MKKFSKNGYLTFIIMFVLLYITVILATLFKYLFASGRGFKQAEALGFIAVVTVLLLLVFVYAIYCFMSRSHLLKNPKQLAVICTCMAISYSVCIFAECADLYLMPMFLTAFLLAPLAKRKDTFTANIFSVLMVLSAQIIEYCVLDKGGVQPILIVSVVGLFSGSLVAFVLSYERRRLDFLIKGVAICFGSIVLILALSYPCREFAMYEGNRFLNILDKAKWVTLAVFFQLLMSIVLQPVLEKLFNLLTNARLVELTDHNSPLIKKLIDEAPGTFNHSLTVAGFAEVCATAIGENPYLARAAAYYHDIGKLTNPDFFKENQHDNNPHDSILPEVSAEIIKSHTAEGLRLCREYRIPQEIASVTVEHHGNMVIPLFYYKAQELTDGAVDMKDYSYSGGVPTTKIAAIIMICDSAEAALRSMDSPDAVRANKLLDKLIHSRIESGQFSSCDITLRQLAAIKDTITGAFGGIYHKRIKYPENV